MGFSKSVPKMFKNVATWSLKKRAGISNMTMKSIGSHGGKSSRKPRLPNTETELPESGCMHVAYCAVQ